MSTNIGDRVNTSRTKVTPKSIKRKREEENQEIEVSTEETVGITKNMKKIKIAENVCSLTTENNLLKQQNDILKQKTEELSKKVELSLDILKDSRKVMSLHDVILQLRRKDTKPL